MLAVNDLTETWIWERGEGFLLGHVENRINKKPGS